MTDLRPHIGVHHTMIVTGFERDETTGAANILCTKTGLLGAQCHCDENRAFWLSECWNRLRLISK